MSVELSTIKSTTMGGIPVLTYNSVGFESSEEVKIEGLPKTYKGYYISYNNYDTHIYGCATTALVVGEMEGFFILNGNHVEKYKELAEQGFEACFNYYNTSQDKSERTDTVESILRLKELLKGEN